MSLHSGVREILPQKIHVDMGVEKRAVLHNNGEEKTQSATAICMHAFSDLKHMTPLVFLYLLKECYIHDTCKATKKFRALQQQVHLLLHKDLQFGPAIFVLKCLYVMPMFESYCEGFSHLIISALNRFRKVKSTTVGFMEGKDLAAQLFLDIVGGFVNHDERIVVKILEVFDIRLENIEKVLCPLRAKGDCSFDRAKTLVERYIFELIESQSYMTAVTLLEHFCIHLFDQSFLHNMIQNNQCKSAEKWASFMGKSTLCALVQEYIDRNMLNDAYKIIKNNSLRQEFPEVYHKGKESSLKKLAEKGCWDVAEAKANRDKQFLEYLVYLALEAGYLEKVDELCNRYSLEGFFNDKVPESGLSQSHHLHLKEFFVEDIVWVDNVDALCNATCHIEGCKVIGLDCEWKPNYIKGRKPNKVSILQIASEKMVFIFDLIKLFEDIPNILDKCLVRILQSPSILKLGYNFQCDIKQLALSYRELECFKRYEMLLDIQNVFKEPRGGLSGLAEKILGSGLNKTRRNSNWEQRPLSQNQLEYAALDAVVLIHIFRHVRNHSQTADVEGAEKIEWKSYISSPMKHVKKFKKLLEAEKEH